VEVSLNSDSIDEIDSWLQLHDARAHVANSKMPMLKALSNHSECYHGLRTCLHHTSSFGPLKESNYQRDECQLSQETVRSLARHDKKRECMLHMRTSRSAFPMNAYMQTVSKLQVTAGWVADLREQSEVKNHLTYR
jgi:hypothetical protein